MSDELVSTGCTKQKISLGVAGRLLEHLSLRGYEIPPHLSSPNALSQLMEVVGLPTYSFEVLVSELCREFRLDPVEYEVMADPAGQQSFTVKVRIGYVERVATADSKNSAQQLAAEQMYKHLRTMLKGSKDFDEEEAMFRAYKRSIKQFDDEQAASVGQQQRRQDEQAAAERMHWRTGENSKQSLAVQATILLELDQSEHSGPTSYEVGPPLPTPGPSHAPDHDSNNAQTADGSVPQSAIQLLLRTMERLGI